MDRMLPAIDMENTGRRIELLRASAGLSVRDLQMIFGFSSPQAIYKWQHGKTLPTVDNLVVLSMVLGVAIDDIIEVKNVGSIEMSA